MDVMINVGGMTDSHSEKKLKEILTRFEAVKYVEVHLHNGKVKIGYNQEKITLEEICEAIEDQGYKVDR